MQDRQHPDALDREEAASREVIAALGQLSRDVEAPPDFLARVLAKADQRPVPRPARISWLGRLPWGVDVAVAAVLILAFVGAVPQYVTWFNAYVRDLPAGEVNAGGDRGQLQLVSVSPQGELRGTLFGTEIVGFWDDPAQKITFIRFMNPAIPATAQLFSGYLFRNPGGLRGVGNTTYTLAGSFTALAGSRATASRSVYGWYAQQGVTE
jgi:hypothetical protein